MDFQFGKVQCKLQMYATFLYVELTISMWKYVYLWQLANSSSVLELKISHLVDLKEIHSKWNVMLYLYLTFQNFMVYNILCPAVLSQSTHFIIWMMWLQAVEVEPSLVFLWAHYNVHGADIKLLFYLCRGISQTHQWCGSLLWYQRTFICRKFVTKNINLQMIWPNPFYTNGSIESECGIISFFVV